MNIELYQEVALSRDILEHGLRRGDVVTVIDFIIHPSHGERGCIIEVFNAIGESITVLIVPESALEPLRANEMLTVRSLAYA